VRLSLQPHQGALQTLVVEIPLPASLAGQTVRIKLRPAYAEERVVPSPESFEDLLQVLPKLDFPGEALVASFTLPDEAGAAHRGHVANRLPPGAADTLRAQTDSVAPEVYGAVKQVVLPTKGFVVGEDNIDVTVREVLR
jgi:hypothetical protein